MHKPENSPSSSNHEQDIETIYTTASAQTEPTDWLTVVRNLRLSNRKLLQQINELEINLNEAQSNLLKQQEKNKLQELTIQKQQEDLKVAGEQLTDIFNQLENSHQIGQKQQVLIETLSEQLEIAQDYIAELENDHQQLQENYLIQSQELTNTKSLAEELNNIIENTPPTNPQIVDTITEQSTTVNQVLPPLGEPLNKLAYLINAEQSVELPPKPSSSPVIKPVNQSYSPNKTSSKPPAPKISKTTPSQGNNSSIELPKFQRKGD
jgi:DNA repair exonuclease SbcCD ATPase subunit